MAGHDLFFKSWAEFFFFIIMVLGFVIALFSTSAFITYILVFLSGMFGGRLMYDRKGKYREPYYLILAGFIVGFLLGSFYGNKAIIVVLFILGNIIGFQMFNQKYVRDLPY